MVTFGLMLKHLHLCVQNHKVTTLCPLVIIVFKVREFVRELEFNSLDSHCATVLPAPYAVLTEYSSTWFNATVLSTKITGMETKVLL